MDLDPIRDFCTSLPHVTEDIKWENHLCFSIAEKLFCIASLETPFTCSLKVSDEEFEELAERPGFKPAPYLARYKWIFVQDINLVSLKEMQYLLMQSYNLIKNKLPAKLKKQLES